MDLLAEVIATVRVGRAESCMIRRTGAWGMRYPAFDVSGFHILTKGSGWLITAGGEPHALTEGDVVLNPSGVEHGLSHASASIEQLPAAHLGADQPDGDPVEAEFLCGAYWLDHGSLPQYLRALAGIAVVSTDGPHLRSLVGLLTAEVSDPRPGSGATRPALIELILTYALRDELAKQHDPRLPLVGDPVIAAALAELHRRPDRPWTVHQLSAAVGMPRRALTQRFVAAVGQPPMAYLTDWRLACGARLLRETTAPLAAIARQIGYSTEFAFGGAFRRKYGIAPGRFRSATLSDATQ
ncbi:AraC family transcriptional regulator [Streptomyces mirabilis]